jgi:hypothetical protein
MWEARLTFNVDKGHKKKLVSVQIYS